MEGDTAGISGRSQLRPLEITVMAALWVAIFVAIGPMASSGVSDSVVYGLCPAAAPLILVGLAWAAIMAAHATLFAGPAGAWLVAGVGVFALLLTRAATIAGRQRRSLVRA